MFHNLMDCPNELVFVFVCIDSIAICNYAIVFRIMVSIRKSQNILTCPIIVSSFSSPNNNRRTTTRPSRTTRLVTPRRSA